MLKGKVAALLDNRTLAINIGEASGVREGMKFRVLDSSNQTIKDPETGETLGKLKLTKAHVKTIKVEEKYCIAETYRHETINEGGTIPSFSKLLQPPKLVKRYETFSISASDRVKLTEEQSRVKIGDEVEQVPEDYNYDEDIPL